MLEGGKVVSPTHRPLSPTPGKIAGSDFFYRLRRRQRHSAAGSQGQSQGPQATAQPRNSAALAAVPICRESESTCFIFVVRIRFVLTILKTGCRKVLVQCTLVDNKLFSLYLHNVLENGFAFLASVVHSMSEFCW